jgi:hypothetical protein
MERNREVAYHLRGAAPWAKDVCRSFPLLEISRLCLLSRCLQLGGERARTLASNLPLDREVDCDEKAFPLSACLHARMLSALRRSWPRPEANRQDRKESSRLPGTRTQVTVETYDGRLFQGSVSEAGADAFVLVYNRRRTTLPYGDVRKIKWPSEVSKQVMVAIGVPAVVGGLVVVLVLIGGLKG